MKILRFDSVGGASGDMILGALVDLGVDLELLRTQVATLAIEGFSIASEPFATHGMQGTRVNVVPPPEASLPHRHLGDIRKLIQDSDITDAAKKLSIRAFERLAEAEARVHNTTAEHVHFHEVGAIDSIVDIVGACVALDSLSVDAVRVGTLPLGTGLTRFSHGVMPVPVPATVELLRGHPVVQTDEPFELVTPTGAALLTAWAEALPCTTSGAARITGTGLGFGQRELSGRPNMLRAITLESGEATVSDLAVVLECNLDDTVPELIGALVIRLLDEGALDVFTTSIQMKKQRPGTLVSVLCREQDRGRLMDCIFTGSTTFGVREYAVKRTVLERRHEDVETAYGTVRVKIGTWKGGDITRAPEYDDCVRLAKEHGVSVRVVYEAATRGS